MNGNKLEIIRNFRKCSINKIIAFKLISKSVLISSTVEHRNYFKRISRFLHQ